MHQGWKRLVLLAVIAAVGMSATLQSDNNKYFEISKNIEIFSNLYKELNTYYVDDLDPGQLMRTGIDAMVESLDPYTNYISESDIEGYRYMTEGRYNGIGAMSKQMGDLVTITELYQDQPADRAGLKVGDQILEVNGQDAVGKTPSEINTILRGFPGTEVKLKVRRPGQADPVVISLMRDEVNVPNVPHIDVVGEDVGYISLTTFTRQAGKNVSNALRDLKSENPDLKGIIFDLRGNGGGLLTEAVNVSNVFVDKGELVVTTRGKVKEWDRSFKTLNQPVDLEIPLVVIIDNYSASASEIVCGVIQDYDRGVLVGQRSYGKGLVQNTRDVGYNAKVKLTTAKYYIPSGRCIQSVEYENGEPVHIPDELRQPFKTRNGREVLDGGGVKPDVLLEAPHENTVVKALIDQNYIFDYVTEFCLEHDSIQDINTFAFTEFDAFIEFLEKRDFDYLTEGEKLVNKLKEVSEDEDDALKEKLSALEKALQASKKAAVVESKDDIVNLIEKEIASRYYYQVGKIEMSLKNDREIEKAISLIHDQEAYEQILRGEE